MTRGSKTTSSKKRQAKISMNDGEPIGVAIFLAADQLRALGIDPVETDEVTYYVEAETEQVIIEQEKSESEE